MQKLIIILLFPMFSFSQFDYNEYVTSNYIEKMTWDTKQNYYQVDDQMYRRYVLYPEIDHCSYIFNYGESEGIFDWEFMGKDHLNMDKYINTNGEKIIVNDDEKEIWIFSNFDKEINRYRNIKVLSNIEFHLKKGEYIPQTKRN
tara:strand:+ start:159 stop:590 length:432 start_codon:yes stop_codon:yes gene_type:complete